MDIKKMLMEIEESKLTATFKLLPVISLKILNETILSIKPSPFLVGSMKWTEDGFVKIYDEMHILGISLFYNPENSIFRIKGTRFCINSFFNQFLKLPDSLLSDIVYEVEDIFSGSVPIPEHPVEYLNHSSTYEELERMVIKHSEWCLGKLNLSTLSVRFDHFHKDKLPKEQLESKKVLFDFLDKHLVPFGFTGL